MLPKIAQVAQKYVLFLNPVSVDLKPLTKIASKIVLGALRGTTLVDLGWIFYEFGWILASFVNDFGHFSAAACVECARNEITENVKNMQISAEIYNNSQAQ